MLSLIWQNICDHNPCSILHLLHYLLWKCASVVYKAFHLYRATFSIILLLSLVHCQACLTSDWVLMDKILNNMELGHSDRNGLRKSNSSGHCGASFLCPLMICWTLASITDRRINNSTVWPISSTKWPTELYLKSLSVVVWQYESLKVKENQLTVERKKHYLKKVHNLITC